MQFLLDNLIAIIVAGMVMLTLHVTQSRSSHASIEQVTSHSVKEKTLIFGQWVEDDILNLGANVGTNMYRIDEPVVDPLTGNTTEWTFFSDSVRAGGAEMRLFKRYRLVETEQATFSNKTFQLYQVERDSAVVDFPASGVPPTTASVPTGAWVLGTRSIGTLSFFEISLLDRHGDTPCPSEAEQIKDAQGKVVDCTDEIDVYKADYVRVRFGVVPEHVLKPDNYIRELYWVRTIKVRPYWTPPPSLPSGGTPSGS